MIVLVLLRIAFSTRSLTTLHSESSMETISVLTIATMATAANVGISLSTEQNAVDHCQLMEYSTCELELHRISIVIATLKDTATKFEEAKYV